MDKNVACPNCQHEFDANNAAAPNSMTSAATGSSPSDDASLPTVSTDEGKPRDGIGRARRYTGRGILFRCGLLLLLVVAAFGIRSAVKTITQPRPAPTTALGKPPGKSKTAAADAPGAKAKRREQKESPDGRATAGGVDKPQAAATELAIDQLEHSVVLLESVGPAGDSSLGSGFVIDGSGLVATSYHVVAHATQVHVRFRDGERCRVAGLAAVEPERDLAILRLETTPLKLVPAPMAGAGDPRQLAPVVALGHPNGVAYSPYDGKVSRVVRTSQLPTHSQRFLQQILTGRKDATWIQHTARLSDGNSGGPLLDRHGRVIGVNTWVDRQSQFSYALHIKHLHDLRKKAGQETQPLGSAEPRDAWVTQWLDELTSERVRQLYDEIAGFRFQPASSSDYRAMQKLAWAVTVANAPSSLTVDVKLEKQFDKLEATTDRMVAKLRDKKWDGPGQILFINEFAAEQIEQPLSGVFVIGTLLRIVEGPEGSSGALIQISGIDRTFFVPLAGRLFSAPKGATLLVMGVNYNGRVVRYGENPLNLDSAPVVVAGALIRLDE